jgi:histidinol-phosphatase (PHP family)
MLWDTHMHTHHSGDSDAVPELMVQAAIDKGLSGLCFTDHFDYDYPDEPELFLLDFDSYQKETDSLRRQYEGILPILWGIELGLQPQVADMNRRVTHDYPFDFIIGSSHVVHGTDPYYPHYYEGRTEDAAYREYFESILENLQTDVDFDVYGHIDYVVRYGPNQNRYYSYKKYADVIDEILRTLVVKGKGIEINTAGFKYGLGHPNPTEEILVRYRELGGEIITIGADAHAPEHVAYAFDRIPEILRQAGFRYYSVFSGRKPQFFPIP